MLDFGCGNGSVLFYCALRGVESCIGIDLAKEGIKLSEERAKLMQCGIYKFIVGDISAIYDIKDESIDAIILSNIIDNLTPGDSVKLLEQAKRILKKDGKVLVKLNPYILEEQIIEYNMKPIGDNLFDYGLLLWNLTTDEWRNLLAKYFNEKQFINIYYPEHEMYNRMFLMTK